MIFWCVQNCLLSFFVKDNFDFATNFPFQEGPFWFGVFWGVVVWTSCLENAVGRTRVSDAGAFGTVYRVCCIARLGLCQQSLGKKFNLISGFGCDCVCVVLLWPCICVRCSLRCALLSGHRENRRARTQTHRNAHTHTDTDTHTDTHGHTQTHADTHTQTDRQTHTHVLLTDLCALDSKHKVGVWAVPSVWLRLVSCCLQPEQRLLCMCVSLKPSRPRAFSHDRHDHGFANKQTQETKLLFISPSFALSISLVVMAMVVWWWYRWQ